MKRALKLLRMIKGKGMHKQRKPWSSRSQMFFQIGALKNFAVFNGKHLCWNLFLTILTREKLCFIQFSTRMTGWLILTFFMCLHNQLCSFMHSITRIKSTDVWKMLFIKWTVNMNGCFFKHVLRQRLYWFLS